MEKERILAIEDDEGVCRLLRHSLAREDFAVRVAQTGEAGLEAALEETPDLLLLDLELPGIDGVEVCRRLKDIPQTRNIPIIILTGKGEEADVVQGLEMGADDYIVKPFSPKILNARVRAVLRRRSEPGPPTRNQVLKVGRLVIDPASDSLAIDNKSFDLNPIEFRFIHALAAHLADPESASGAQQEGEEGPVDFLRREGMSLYAENRLERLVPVLEELLAGVGRPEAILGEIAGIALFSASPERSLELLRQAEEGYVHDKDVPGLLTVQAQLVFHHLVIDGDCEAAAQALSRAEKMTLPAFDLLPVWSRVFVAQNLAYGYAILLDDTQRATEYLEIAEALAEERGMVNLIARNRLARMYGYYVAGDLLALTHELDESLRLLTHPQVSGQSKALLKLFQLRGLALTGEHDYLLTRSELLQEEFRAFFPDSSLPALQLSLGRIEVWCSRGEYDRVLALCQEKLADPLTAANSLMRPLLNGALALAAAATGDKKLAGTYVDECLADSSPLKFRTAQAKLLCARAQDLAGRSAEAMRELATLSSALEVRGWSYLRLQARVMSMALALRDGRAVDADGLRELLAEMDERQLGHFFGLTRADLQLVLQHALEHGVAEEFVALLARDILQLALSAGAEPVPLLEIRLLGTLQLSLAGTPVARAEDFSKTQREFFALLAAVPDNRMNQEEVQLVFWPDSKPEKARSTLDTTLSRLRKTLQAKIAPHSTRNYLRLQKGVVGLANCSLDATRVLQRIEQAREHVRCREFWQADTCYASALGAWGGQYSSGSCNSNEAAGFAADLQAACVKASMEWSELLNEQGESRRAIEALKRALVFDRINEKLVRELYRSYMRSNDLAQAQQVLKKYEETLRDEGYPAATIAGIMSGLGPGRA